MVVTQLRRTSFAIALLLHFFGLWPGSDSDDMSGLDQIPRLTLGQRERSGGSGLHVKHCTRPDHLVLVRQRLSWRFAEFVPTLRLGWCLVCHSCQANLTSAAV